MQEKIRGIVLRTVKYGDTGLIVDMFTLQYGRRSFATKVTKGRRTASNASLWNPLAMVEFDADIRPNGKLPAPKEARLYYNNMRTLTNPVKSALALFLSEFLCSALKSETENTALYSYMEMSLQLFDSTEKDFANFHLVFLMRLTRFLGIYPNLDSASPLDFFNMESGCFCKARPYHPNYLNPDDARRIPQLFRMNYDTMHLFRMSRTDRWNILGILNSYYSLHIPGFPELKSLDILHEVFD